MDTTQLTVKEALEQGYTRCGYGNEEWQTALHIADLDSEDFNVVGRNRLMLMSKEHRAPSVTSSQISDLIADNVSEMHGNDTGDDTDSVYDLIKAMNFNEIVSDINATLSTYKYWDMTDIELIPNP